MEHPLGEDLIQIWLRMSSVLKNNRLISTMTFNEIFICNILYHHKCCSDTLLTATEVGQKTKLLKSQMNKIISSLEKQGLIRRIRGTKDRRKVYLEFVEENSQVYLSEHQRILSMLDELTNQLGEDMILKVIHLMTEVTDAMETITANNRKEENL